MSDELTNPHAARRAPYLNIERLEPGDYACTRELLTPLDFHLVLQSILAGLTPATLYVDAVDQPTAVFGWSGHRFFLAGRPDNAAFNAAVRNLFVNEIYPQSLTSDTLEAFVLVYAPGWEAAIADLLHDKHPIRRMHQYYAITPADADAAAAQDWRARTPPDFQVHAADAALLAQTHLANLDLLREEMCSERPSVPDFLARSFGYCAVHAGQTLAGWCLSEYNTDDRCEVGIATLAPFQRQGLAALLGAALIDHAFSVGMRTVGWHCWADNLPSVKTALKLGLSHVCDYPSYLAFFDPALNLAVNGDMAFSAGDYGAARDWYRRAFAAGQSNAWAYWNAACAYARLGEVDAALAHLQTAVAHGFTNLDHIRNSSHMNALHVTPGWQALIAKLEAQSN